MSQQSVPITGNEKGVSSQSISEPDKVTTAQWGQNISEVNFNLICQQYNLWTTFIIFKNIPDRIFFVNPSEYQKDKSLASKRFCSLCIITF